MKGIQFYKKANNILGWIVFLIASLVYILTMEKTGSFWDCGEFIAGAYKLQVVHPPGAPFFNIIGRIFTLFSFGDVTQVAVMVNLMSALSTAFAVLFGFWSTSAVLRKLILKKEEDYTQSNILAILGSALVAGLTITFSDSLWFSAVEGEVYALSMFFMTFVFWATLKWDADDSPEADRWLLLIAFMIGLSTGVHLLSLLAIPFTALIVYLKKFRNKITPLGFLTAFVISFLIIGVVMKGVIAGFPLMFTKMELLFVNGMGMPFNTGVWIYILFTIAVFAGALFYVRQKNKVLLEKIILGLAFLIIGYSSFLLVPIRSEANTPINMNKPADAFKMLSYLNREQYGERPLVFGPDYTLNPQDDYKQKNGQFEKTGVSDLIVKGKDQYDVVEKDGKFKYVVKDERKMFFPRLGVVNDPAKVPAYRAWIQPDYKVYDRQTKKTIAKFKANQLNQAEAYVQQRNAANESGYGASRYRVLDDLSWGDNIKFFFHYQLGYMYMRYFMWNFSGRQNDLQGTYGNADGAWITGINFIDNNINLWGSPRWTQDNLSQKRLNNKARNKFYGIPFILGLIGLYWLFKKSWKMGVAFVVIFLTTGVFFIVYGNQPPIEPRERDYVVVGSFFIFAMWIGMSAFAIFDLLKSKVNGNVAAPIAILLTLVAPILMGSQGWDDHNRSFRTVPVDMAVNYLESCAPNAIIFTQGDNDTYPLWYAQEVEGIRTDVRVVNVSLLSADWYINQLRYKMNNSAPLKLTFTPEMIKANNRNYIQYINNPNIDKSKYYNAQGIMKFIAKDDPKIKAQTKRFGYYLPTTKMAFPVSKSAIETMKMTNAPDSLIVSEMQVDLAKSNLMKGDLMTLDIVANNINERPIYFAISVAPSVYLGLQKYFQQEGLTYRIVPVENKGGQAGAAPVNREAMYENLMTKFKWGKIPENPNVYIDENIMRMTQNVVSSFTKLAQSYISVGDKEKAVALADKCLAVLPLDKININYFHAPLVSVYLKAGESEKAKALADKIVETSQDELDYMVRVYKEEKKNYAPGEFGRLREVSIYLYLLQQISREYQTTDAEYSKEVVGLLQDYSSKLQ